MGQVKLDGALAALGLALQGVRVLAAVEVVARLNADDL